VNRPVIGIGGVFVTGTDGHERVAIRTEYVDRVWEAGGRPVVLAPGPIAESDFAWLDGYLMAGGGDLPPEQYGEEPHPKTVLEDDRRTRFELEFLRTAPADLPILGVCMGCQAINIVRGGTLVQHLPDVVGDHRHEGGTAEKITVQPDSHLGSIIGPCADGKSYHHQALGRVGEGLRVVAVAEDGTIEAVEDTTGRWLVGVQWHPERSPDAASTQRLFAAFIAAARERSKKRTA
jgi:putative glutamine amidotransferase